MTALRQWCVAHRPFVVALALGAAVRVIASLAFSPGLVFSDGPLYLGFLHRFAAYPDHVAGYSMLLLYPLSLLTGRLVLAATVAQHVLGLSTATLLYLMLRRWGVGRGLATLATLPVLFDAMQLLLEQSVFSDTLFVLLLTIVMALLGWRRRPTPGLAVGAGLCLGAAVTVREVGEPLVVLTTAFCLIAGHGWRGRLLPAAALLVGFAVPVTAYAAFYHHTYGVYALSQFDGKALWLRSTTFVDCSRLSVPHYERVLCPAQALGHRRDPTYYGWHDPQTLPRLHPPPGTTRDEAMGQFGAAAIRAQPLDYLRVGLRDFALNFDVARVDRFGYDTAYKWHFSHYVTGWAETRQQLRAYHRNGGQQLVAHEPWAYFLAGYSWVVYLPGPLLLGCLAVGLSAGLVRVCRDPWTRSMCLLLTLSGTVLLLVPGFTVEFVWRYQLPALVLLPAGAALAWSAIRRPPGAEGAAGNLTGRGPAADDLRAAPPGPPYGESEDGRGRRRDALRASARPPRRGRAGGALSTSRSGGRPGRGCAPAPVRAGTSPRRCPGRLPRSPRRRSRPLAGAGPGAVPAVRGPRCPDGSRSR
ncbi:MAG: hypothetical protein QOD35_1767 [Nocardioidaceae bacterium]|nr:hypothetical protein [Nocardioidaceae bacterium]